ncbi:MAG: GIY-YIG nuclease family protein [Faecalibacterium sp.]|nr:GIY-YIG nuclease family protein [Faecalibacterium sp.]
MAKIMLNDLLRFDTAEVPNVRVKFNIYNGYDDPLDLYKTNPDEVNVTWFLWHDDRRYFNVGQTAICLLKLRGDQWLLTTIKKITRLLDVTDGVGYDADEVKEYEQYFGRLVVEYHNPCRTMGRKYENVMDELEVVQILNEQYTGNEFPGYENVRLSYPLLKNIVDRQLPGWVDALRNQKAVYLITDTKTGKMYVGSATSQTGMLLQRWSNYIADGHGGNKALKELVKKQGFDYVKENFQYSILENYNARMDDEYILRRESWWKETLRTREFGYNKN